MAQYTYNAWGEILSSTGDMAGINSLRYRGYYYDFETGFYYLQSRYYDPANHRFINADTSEYSTMSAYSLNDSNLFVYCANNPVSRADDDGHFWSLIAKAFVGVVSQHFGDVIGIIASGKTGWDILKPTSSVGEYIAAGVTAMIPGSGFGANLTRNITGEVIVTVEKKIKGEDVSLGSSLANIALGTAFDGAADWVSGKVTKAIGSYAPVNYSSYAGKQYKKNAEIAKDVIYSRMRRAITINNLVCDAVDFGIQMGRNALPY